MQGYIKYMRILAFITAFILAAPAYAEFRDTSKPMTVQTQLDVNRYLGKWYEIARYPNRFERDCVGVTAEYSLRKNGKINVVNTCFKEVLGGRKKTAKGRAKVEGPGKLSVNSRLSCHLSVVIIG